jgi:hypothetical protein
LQGSQLHFRNFLVGTSATDFDGSISVSREWVAGCFVATARRDLHVPPTSRGHGAARSRLKLLRCVPSGGSCHFAEGLVGRMVAGAVAPVMYDPADGAAGEHPVSIVPRFRPSVNYWQSVNQPHPHSSVPCYTVTVSRNQFADNL